MKRAHMHRTLALRRLTPVALVAVSALLLAGCGSSGKPSSADKASTSPSASATGACGDVASGATSDSVKVTGDFGTAQTATFPTPLTATKLERTVLTKGTGNTTAAGQTVDALISVFLGKDGKSLGTETVSLPVADATMIKAFSAGVDCLAIGSRVVVTAPAKDMYGAAGNTRLGVTAKDSLVIVTDVIGLKKQLVPQAWTKHVPKVTFGAKGKPTVKLPSIVPPTELMLKVLRPGTGAVVKAGDTVTLNYQGTSWDTGKIFDQSYGKQPASFKTDQVVEGFGAALIGQKVGTRLVVTIPPKYAYGEKGAGQTLSGQTLLFVIEIQNTATS